MKTRLYLLLFFVLLVFSKAFGQVQNETITVMNTGATNINSWWIDCTRGTTAGGRSYLQNPNYITHVSGACVGNGTFEIRTFNETTTADSLCSSPTWCWSDYTVHYTVVGNATVYNSGDWMVTGGHWNCATTNSVTDTDSHTFYIGGAPLCFSNLTWTVHNTTAQSGVFAVWDVSGQYQNFINLDPGQTGTLVKNGVPCADIPLYGVIQLQSMYVLGTATGTNGSYTYVASSLLNDYTDFPGDLTAGASSGSTAGSGGSLGTGGTGGAGGSTPITYNPDSTNAAQILWSNTNLYTTDNSGVISAIKNETVVLFDSFVKIGAQAHDDSVAARALATVQLQTNGINGVSAQAGVSVLSNLLSQINGKTGTNGASTNMTVQNWPAGYSNFLGQISLNTSNLIIYGSNDWSNLQLINSNLAKKFNQDTNNAGYLSQMATNGFGTNVAQQGTLAGISNLLGSIDATNRAEDVQDEMDATNVPSTSKLWSALQGFQHDAAGATAAAGAALGDTLAAHDSVASSLAGLNNGDGMSGGSPISVDVVAGTYGTFHIAPESSMFSGIFALAKKVFTWILIAGYYVKVVQTIVMFIRDITKTRGVWVSDISFSAAGFGGNALGVLLFPLMVTALFLVWASTLAVMYSGISGYLAGMSLSSLASVNPVGGMESGALHLLLECFPLSLAMGLICAWITFHFTCGRILLIANGIVRFLPGA